MSETAKRPFDCKGTNQTKQNSTWNPCKNGETSKGICTNVQYSKFKVKFNAEISKEISAETG